MCKIVVLYQLKPVIYLKQNVITHSFHLMLPEDLINTCCCHIQEKCLLRTTLLASTLSTLQARIKGTRQMKDCSTLCDYVLHSIQH